jgi:hypothetical protein
VQKINFSLPIIFLSVWIFVELLLSYYWVYSQQNKIIFKKMFAEFTVLTFLFYSNW